MSLAEDLAASGDVGLAFARAVEPQLGEDTLLTVGVARPSVAAIFVEDPARIVLLHYSSGEHEGAVAVALTAALAQTLEQRASDEILVTSLQSALEASAHNIGEFGGIEIETQAAEEVDLAGLEAAEAGGPIFVYPILDGDEVVAGLAVLLGTTELRATAANSSDSTPASAVTAAGGSSAFVLSEVEMGVTAELGRTRMTVRELLSVTPGAVIDLDRSAGAPVDVLVNGTLIARGEVVVIDEEFGIRISELIPQSTPVH